MNYQPSKHRLKTDGSRPTDQSTRDEVAAQIHESNQGDSGPNETLRQNIGLFSRYAPIFRSLGHTLIGAFHFPAFIAFIAYQLRPAYELNLLQGAVTRGLWTLCLPLFGCLALARALRPGGLAERHFGWAPNLCEGLLKTLNAMIWIWLPLRFFYTGLETLEGGKWNDSLGRILFVMAMIGFSIGLWRTANSLRRWIYSSEHSSPWIDNFRSFLFWFLPLMPASLAAMSALGYHFTAVQMSWRVMWTVILMIGISMIGGLISRLLLVAQFGIKLRQLARDDDGEINPDESIDISEISAQVNRLLRATALVAMVVVGWQFWANVVPAINYLDEWRLWSLVGTDGVKIPINLRHLLMAMGVVVITFVLSRNLPGLLEITLLDRLPLDRGGRYAISFVVRYLVGIIGLLAACQIVGFTWSNVQWLAAGLTVGLGFGLQEIFANVVSGIIILIERPVRVGDVVSVNGTTGTVTRMQLRATTIKDLDFRELIVPNKKFITEDVMNWTLTDRRSRIILEIGVAYGSDTELVQSTLLKVADRHPLVQTEPHPDVFFKEFGESTLNFQLRVFIPSREIYAKVQHECNYFANCLAVLHEHIRLQPYISKSLPFLIRKCVTQRLMTYSVGAKQLSVHEDVPPLGDAAYPKTLLRIDNPQLNDFLDGPNGWNAGRRTLENTRANDWTQIRERMGYIVNLFRTQHVAAEVVAAPYSEEQFEAIEAGILPPAPW